MARVLIQTVNRASVVVEGESVAELKDAGLLVYVGIARGDSIESLTALARKVSLARVLSQKNGKPFEVSLVDSGKPALLVSNFTLCGDLKSGRKPSWSNAAKPGEAAPLFHSFVQAMRDESVVVKTGVFGAEMVVDASVHGPMNLLVEFGQ